MGPLNQVGLAAVLALIAAPLSAARADGFGREIALASKRFGIPASWIREVMDAESAGRNAILGVPIVSPAGAMGLMQLMPATWSEMRDAHELGTNPFDPHDNILAGTAYLRAMYDRFGYPGLFAAYNAGPSRYERFLAGTELPAESMRYAARITGRIEKRARLAATTHKRAGAPGRESRLSGIFIVLQEPATELQGAESRRLVAIAN
ncbi:lytic transglycosylase domain-containing protein [Sphingomonas agri]|uniref:lytic transglycosylase domain-containing protein n=1 Tax=Sphingomonas agri TaxID=1813878 RepID=UPI00356B6FD6